MIKPLFINETIHPSRSPASLGGTPCVDLYLRMSSPTWSNTECHPGRRGVRLPDTHVSRQIAVSADGQTLYTGSYSNLWKSTDGGQNFGQLMRPQPLPGTFGVPGALGGWAAFDVAVSPRDPNTVLAMTRYDLRSNDHGLYRSTDVTAPPGRLSVQFPNSHDSTAGQIVVWAQDDPDRGHVAGGTSVAAQQEWRR